ncbi:hypothetical protein [Microcoleus sp. B7-D4]
MVSDYDIKKIGTLQKEQSICINIKLILSFLESAIASARLDIKYL